MNYSVTLPNLFDKICNEVENKFEITFEITKCTFETGAWSVNFSFKVRTNVKRIREMEFVHRNGYYSERLPHGEKPFTNKNDNIISDYIKQRLALGIKLYKHRINKIDTQINVFNVVKFLHPRSKVTINLENDVLTFRFITQYQKDVAARLHEIRKLLDIYLVGSDHYNPENGESPCVFRTDIKPTNEMSTIEIEFKSKHRIIFYDAFDMIKHTKLNWLSDDEVEPIPTVFQLYREDENDDSLRKKNELMF